MTVDSNGNLVHTIDQRDIESLIREKEATPADYVNWYRHSHGYAFPPQAQVEKLFGVLSRVLNERFAHDRQRVTEETIRDFGMTDPPKGARGVESLIRSKSVGWARHGALLNTRASFRA